MPLPYGSRVHVTYSAFSRCLLLALVASMLAAESTPAAIGFETETGNRPELFGNGMVLQRSAIVPVWGTSAADASIRAEFVNPAGAPGSQLVQSRTTSASPSGRWVVRFDDLPVGGPYELRFFENGEAAASVVLGDVLVGDVWLLSGQSNMVLRGPRDGDAELYPQVRAITTAQWGQRPSGAAFYFGAQLHDALGIPIGLINRAQADTALGHWLPVEVAADADPVVQSLFSGCDGEVIRRCFFYDLHIRPLERPLQVGEQREGVALRGVVWWQGEKGDDKRAMSDYMHLFPAMMRAWRANLGQPELVFVYHQMPSGTGLAWTGRRAGRLPRTYDPDHWQARQRITFFRMLAFPRTSLMSSIDLEPGTHPRDFDLYGRRLGDAALGTTYAVASQATPYPYSGPVYESATLESGGGGPDAVRIRFREHTAANLTIGPNTEPATEVLQGFAVCCNNEGGFVFADARIESGDEVMVSHADVQTPTAVHYAIGRNARWANLFNGSERGAAPFSTELAPFPDQDPDLDGFWEPGPYSEGP